MHDYKEFLQEFEEFRIRARHLFEARHLATLGGGLACGGEWVPAVDVFESGETIVLAAEIAGVRREDVSIEVAGTVLTLRGTRPCGRAGAAPESYLRMEVPTGSFERSFRLPWPAAEQGVKARLVDGVLTVRVPRGGSDQGRRIPVESA